MTQKNLSLWLYLILVDLALLLHSLFIIVLLMLGHLILVLFHLFVGLLTSFFDWRLVFSSAWNEVTSLFQKLGESLINEQFAVFYQLTKLFQSLVLPCNKLKIIFLFPGRVCELDAHIFFHFLPEIYETLLLKINNFVFLYSRYNIKTYANLHEFNLFMYLVNVGSSFIPLSIALRNY